MKKNSNKTTVVVNAVNKTKSVVIPELEFDQKFINQTEAVVFEEKIFTVPNVEVPKVVDNSASMFQSFLTIMKNLTTKPAKRIKENIVLLSSKMSGAGRIDMLLKRAEGCTIEEMRECRGAVEAHLAALRRNGFNIVCTKGRYYHVAETI